MTSSVQQTYSLDELPHSPINVGLSVINRIEPEGAVMIIFMLVPTERTQSLAVAWETNP